MLLRQLLAAASACLATAATADVADLAASGFLIRHEVTVTATPEVTYRMLLDVARWWSPAHSYSGDTANMSIEARPGGCFCEKLPNGGAVQHMSVVLVMPNSMLRLTGGLGPLQGSGLAGSMTWRLTAAPPGTKVELTYSVGGTMQGGFEKMAPAVNGMLGEQIARLKSAIDTGNPVAAR